MILTLTDEYYEEHFRALDDLKITSKEFETYFVSSYTNIGKAVQFLMVMFRYESEICDWITTIKGYGWVEEANRAFLAEKIRRLFYFYRLNIQKFVPQWTKSLEEYIFLWEEVVVREAPPPIEERVIRTVSDLNGKSYQILSCEFDFSDDEDEYECRPAEVDVGYDLESEMYEDNPFSAMFCVKADFPDAIDDIVAAIASPVRCNKGCAYSEIREKIIDQVKTKSELGKKWLRDRVIMSLRLTGVQEKRAAEICNALLNPYCLYYLYKLMPESTKKVELSCPTDVIKYFYVYVYMMFFKAKKKEYHAFFVGNVVNVLTTIIRMKQENEKMEGISSIDYRLIYKQLAFVDLRWFPLTPLIVNYPIQGFLGMEKSVFLPLLTAIMLEAEKPCLCDVPERKGILKLFLPTHDRIHGWGVVTERIESLVYGKKALDKLKCVVISLESLMITWKKSVIGRPPDGQVNERSSFWVREGALDLIDALTRRDIAVVLLGKGSLNWVRDKVTVMYGVEYRPLSYVLSDSSLDENGCLPYGVIGEIGCDDTSTIFVGFRGYKANYWDVPPMDISGRPDSSLHVVWWEMLSILSLI